jgi:hypothetical protein
MQATFRLMIDRELLRQARTMAARESLSVDQFFAEIMERLVAEHESSRLPDHLPAERKRNGPVRRKNRG